MSRTGSPQILDRRLLAGQPWPSPWIISTRGPLIGENQLTADPATGAFTPGLGLVNMRTGATSPPYRKWLWSRIKTNDRRVLEAMQELTPEHTLICVDCEKNRICHSRVIVSAWEHLRAAGELSTPPRSATVVNMRRDSFEVFIGRNSLGKVPPLPVLPAFGLPELVAAGEAGCFGNPFEATHAPGADALTPFRAYLDRRTAEEPAFRAAILGLAGFRLGCTCKPGPCHGDAIVDWLDENLDSL